MTILEVSLIPRAFTGPAPPTIAEGLFTTDSTKHQFEVLDGLHAAVEQHLTKLLPVETAWQPSEFLPDLTRDDWRHQLEAFREASACLSDEFLVALVGSMITEEALPSYAISLNRIARDPMGDTDSPWARWMRGWIAEENRHGDLLNAYLRLSGRVDMKSIELSVHHLINGGFNSGSLLDPYAGLIYTSFQERATTVSHANAGRMAAALGDENLSRICKKIAADESRHEQFYSSMMGEVVKVDPELAILIFRKMMKRTIVMPGRRMNDGKNPNLFDDYATVAQRLSIYTASDYAQIVAYLVNAWKIGSYSMSGAAAHAQEFLCVLAERLEATAASVREQVLARSPAPFRWIHDRSA